MKSTNGTKIPSPPPTLHFEREPPSEPLAADHSATLRALVAAYRALPGETRMKQLLELDCGSPTMWVEAILTNDDLATLLVDLCPLTIGWR